MALIDQWGNETIVARMEEQEKRAADWERILEQPQNRAQRRALRKAKMKHVPGKREMKAAAKKTGTEDALRRRVAFFGPNSPIVGFNRKARWWLSIPGSRGGPGYRAQNLSAAESHTVDKLLRKARKKQEKEKRG